MKRAGLIFATALALCLSACASVDMAQNARPGPAFVLEDYFAGETRAYGVFEDRSGKVTRTFSVVTKGIARANGFTLDERFLWSDGERQSRTWTFTKAADGSYQGTAGDVVGTATLEMRGDAMRLRYLLKLPNKGSSIDVRFDDWSHLVADGVAINRADVSKFGVSLGRVTLAFVKSGHPAPTAEMLKQAF